MTSFLERLLLVKLLVQKTHIFFRANNSTSCLPLGVRQCALNGEDASTVYELTLYFTPWQLGCALSWRHAVRVIGRLSSRKYRAVQALRCSHRVSTCRLSHDVWTNQNAWEGYNSRTRSAGIYGLQRDYARVIMWCLPGWLVSAGRSQPLQFPLHVLFRLHRRLVRLLTDQASIC